MSAEDSSLGACRECNDIAATTGPSGSHQLAASTAPPPMERLAADEDVLRPETFVPMPVEKGPAVYIEYCDRCRWAPRASWIATELFLTFPPPAITSITLQPTLEHGGRFRIWLDRGLGAGKQLVWDRKVEGGFPELKVLKQRIRDHVKPEQDLGHSDALKKEKRTTQAEQAEQ